MLEIEKQLSELRSRAAKANYQNQIPKYPKNPNPSTLVGFNKRLANWTNILIEFEKQKA